MTWKQNLEAPTGCLARIAGNFLLKIVMVRVAGRFCGQVDLAQLLSLLFANLVLLRRPDLSAKFLHLSSSQRLAHLRSVPGNSSIHRKFWVADQTLNMWLEGVRRAEDVTNLKNVRYEDVIFLCESGCSPAITAVLEAVGKSACVAALETHSLHSFLRISFQRQY